MKGTNDLDKRGLIPHKQIQVFFDEEGKAHKLSLTQIHVEDLPRKIHMYKSGNLEMKLSYPADIML